MLPIPVSISSDYVISRDEFIETPRINFAAYLLNRQPASIDENEPFWYYVDSIGNIKSPQSKSYKHMKEDITRFGCGLTSYGIGSADKVAILLPNHLQYFSIVYSLTLIGTIFCPINPSLTVYELRNIFKLIGINVVITNSTLYNSKLNTLIEEIFQAFKLTVIIEDKASPTQPIEINNGTTVVYSGEFHETPASLLTYQAKRSAAAVECNEANYNNTAAIIFSSGTGGLCKGAQLTHYNMVANIQQCHSIFHLTHEARILCVLPFSHIFSLQTIGNYSFYTGAKVVVIPAFEPELFLHCIDEYSITHLILVPSLVSFLLKSPLITQFSLASVTTLFSGAAPLSSDTVEQFRQRFPHVSILQGWGMTEVSGGLIATPAYGPPMLDGCAGIPVVNCRCRVVSLVSGRPMGWAESQANPGELLVWSASIMKGYWNSAESDIIDAQGWLHTGDIAYYNEKGHIFVIDRVKELIKYKGFSIAPAEIEALLLNHQAIDDCIIIGVQDASRPENGQIPKAYVKLKRSSENSNIESNLHEYISKHLADYKTLRGGIEVLSDEYVIPRTPAGKLKRFSFSEQYQDGEGIKAKFKLSELVEEK